MKVTVYFEAASGSHIVAQFDEDGTYAACLPSLEKLAASKGYIVTESLADDVAQTPWSKANEAFYKWESDYGDESDLSDDDRMIWVEGYLQALRDAS